MERKAGRTKISFSNGSANERRCANALTPNSGLVSKALLFQLSTRAKDTWPVREQAAPLRCLISSEVREEVQP
jgi:hypothetical protein